MIYGFSLDEVLRMSCVPRWVIIDMVREQSVAEHALNTTIIAKDIAERLKIPSEDIVAYCLVHDLPEVVTGDIPSSFKRHVKDAVCNVEQSMFPQLLNAKNKLTPKALR